jgi:hypothetical protein
MTRRLPGYSSNALIDKLREMKPSGRAPGSRSAIAFTKDEIEAILDARSRGVSWPEINANLPIPYTLARNLNAAVFRIARGYGLNPSLRGDDAE